MTIGGPKRATTRWYRTLQKAYRLYGKPERFAHVRDLRSHSMTPYLPELAPWIDLHLKPLPSDTATAPQPCGEPPADADLNPLRYMQRQIVRKAEALPADIWQPAGLEPVSRVRGSMAAPGLCFGRDAPG